MKRSTPRHVTAILATAAFLVFSVLPIALHASQASPAGPPEKIAGEMISLQDSLPLEPQVRTGVLKNGLTYYIRRNDTPKNRAELRLVVNAGSILEDDDQRGLAHFLEHMAFNGTEHFEKQRIIEYLESIGMKFGADLNAYTTYDETVYMLEVPTDLENALDTAVRIMNDWAQHMSLDSDEIDGERGVIIEEWRTRQGAETRIREKQEKDLFYHSRYEERNPIGSPESIKTFKREALVRFYRDWYRPDLVAVVAVGDFEPDDVKGLIEKYFSGMEQVVHPRQRKYYPIPDHEQTLYGIVTDREEKLSSVTLVSKKDPRPVLTAGDYRDRMIESLFYLMLNSRLEEETRSADAQILNAYAGRYRAVRTKQFSLLGAQVKENGVERGFRTLLEEALRVKQFGFTRSELERAKKELSSQMEQQFAERDKTESSRYASEYVRNYLESEPIPGIEYKHRFYQEQLPKVTLEDLTDLSAIWLKEADRVILASMPEKEGLAVPTQKGLEEIQDQVITEEIQPYKDRVIELPLVRDVPTPGRIRSEKQLDPPGITVLELSNGARVVLKPTAFKNDQVLLSAFSPGGTSLASDERYVAARTAADLVIESGVGDFSRSELEKKLGGKNVEVNPWIDDLYEGMNGSCTPGDLKTMFQLIYLYFTKPRIDEDAFRSYRDRLRSRLLNRESSPEGYFVETLQRTLAGENMRGMPLTSDMLVHMNLETSYNFYKERFSDAGNFTFFFVGHLDPEAVRLLIETYLASLPSTRKGECWRDLGIRTPEGIVKRTVTKGIEQKGAAAVVFHGPLKWSWEQVFVMQALADVLEIPLRESLREKESGTYGVDVSAEVFHYPASEYRLSVFFETSPGRVEDLVQRAFAILRGVREKGPTAADVDKVREILRRERETDLMRNEFWLSILRTYYMEGFDPRKIKDYDTLLDSLSVESIQEAAQRYVDFTRYVELVLYPEDWKPEENKAAKKLLGEVSFASFSPDEMSLRQ
jgi:zinc protease